MLIFLKLKKKETKRKNVYMGEDFRVFAWNGGLYKH